MNNDHVSYIVVTTFYHSTCANGVDVGASNVYSCMYKFIGLSVTLFRTALRPSYIGISKFTILYYQVITTSTYKIVTLYATKIKKEI
nr:MAG TPA: hypothetical protein [Caudoviricetes sp.]